MSEAFTHEQLVEVIELSKKQVEEMRYFLKLSREGMDD
jgi:hypothetical protein